MRDVNDSSMQPEHRRQDGDEKPGVDRVKEHLEERVERHKASSILRVALRQISFQTITMAMQRARPIMISPAMYSG